MSTSACVICSLFCRLPQGMGPSYATAQLQLHGGGIASNEGGGGMVQHLTPYDLDVLVSRMVDMRLQQQQLADHQHGMDRGGQASANRAPHMEPILRGGGAGGGGGHKVRHLSACLIPPMLTIPKSFLLHREAGTLVEGSSRLRYRRASGSPSGAWRTRCCAQCTLAASISRC